MDAASSRSSAEHGAASDTSGRDGASELPLLDRLRVDLREGIDGHDWPGVADIIEREWGFLLMKHFELLREAFIVTPADVFADRPAARAVREMCYPIGLWVPGRARAELSGDRDEVLSLAESAHAVDALMASHAAMIVMRLRAEWERARRQADGLVVLLEALVHRRFNDVARRMPGIEMQIGVTYLMAGDKTAALRHFHRAHSSADFDLLGYVGRDAAAKLAVVHALNGEVVQAEQWLAASEATPASPVSMGAYIESSLAVARALVAVATLDQQALAACERAMAGGGTVEELWALWLHARARVGLLRGDLIGSLRLLATMPRTLPNARRPPPFLEALLLADEADLLIASGAGTPARELLTRSWLDVPSVQVSLSRVMLLTGDDDGCAATAATTIGHDAGGPLVDVEAMVLAGVAHHRAGRRDDARSTVESAATLAGVHGCWIGFAGAPRAEVDEVVDGLGLALPDGLPKVYPDSLTVIDLTRRERVVLTHLYAGRTPSEIAGTEYVSINTVRSQVASLYRKLGVSNRHDALERARAEGIVSPAPPSGRWW